MITLATLSCALAPRVRRFLRSASLTACLTAALAGGPSLSAGAQMPVASQIPPRITTRLDEGQRTTLQGNTPPQAQSKYDQGAVTDSTPANRMLLVLKRSDAQEKELRRLVEDQHNPASASFHQWLKPEEFGSRFGPADSDIQQVKAWLEAKGFTINRVGRGKVTIEFSGTAGQLKAAFKTELRTYRNGNAVYHANSSDPQIPAAFAPVITGFASLNDIKPKSNSVVMGKSSLDLKHGTAVPQWNYASECATFANGQFTPFECTYYPPTPGDLAVQYNINPVYKAGTTGKGVTIGVLSSSNVDLGVVQNYRTLFGFANTANLPQVIVDGDDPGQNGAAGEAYLDVEASAAMAPDATTNLYVSADTLTTSGLINAIARGVDDNAADILTLSYGECEQNLGSSGNQFFYQAWEQAAAQGQSVFVSAGDAGSAGCDNFNQEGQATLGLAVNGFASTPFDTAVGGTDFYYSDWKEGRKGTDLIAQLQASWSTFLPATEPNTTLVAPIQEQPWNDGYGLDINNGNFGYDIVAGSGGASSCVQGSGVDPVFQGYTSCTAGYPKPSWQVGAGVPADGVRDLPDVSLFAASGANLSYWPICAGIYDCRLDTSNPDYSIVVTGVGGTSAATPAMAGIMALVDQAQKGRQGNANFTLYPLAAQYPAAFNDVTVGSNNVVCTQGTPNCSLDTNGDGLYTLQHYSAGVGYDLASGLGSVNVANLIADWSKLTYKTTATTLSLSASSITHGAPATVTTGVTASTGTPAGSVALTTTSITPGQTGLGTIELKNGTGSASITSLPGGTYSIEGTYSGDGVFASSTSSAASITVAPEASTVTLTATDYNSNVYPPTATTLAAGGKMAYNDLLVIDATVAGKSGNGTATGQVTFLDGTKTLGVANVTAQGIAELTTGLLTPGSHSISASYVGDASFNASIGAGFPITITQGIPNLNILFAAGYSNGNQVIYAGQPFLTKTQLSGGSNSAAPTGSVTVSFGAIGSQTAPLVAGFAGVALGEADVTFTPTTPGSYTLTASYSGDAIYAGGTDPNPQTVVVLAPTLAQSTTTMTSSTTAIAPDGIVTFNATVTGSVADKTPTGSMSFLIGPFGYSVKLDSNGKATVGVGGEGFASGANTVVAQYQGDSVYAQSSSAPVTITANVGDFSLTTSDSNIVVKSGSTATAALTIAEMNVNYVNGGLSGPVNFTCSPASAAITCSLSPSTVNLPTDGSQASTTLTINSHVPVTTSQSLPPEIYRSGGEIAGGGVGIAMLVLLISPRRRRLPHLFVLVLILGMGFGAVGCGGTGTKPTTPAAPGPTGDAAPGNYKVSVMSNAGGVQHSLTFNVIVQ